jgi:hypothetical protein
MGGQEYLDGEAGETENVPDVARMIWLLSVQKHLPANLMLHVEPQAHHNEAAWRQEFPRAVEWLFGLKARAEPSRAEPSRAAEREAQDDSRALQLHTALRWGAAYSSVHRDPCFFDTETPTCQATPSM